MNLFPIIRTFLAKATKVAFLPFLKYAYDGPAKPVPPPTLIEGAFTRANTPEDGAKSGAIRYNGSTFEELALNEPRITKLPDHQISCDVLALFPSIQNQVTTDDWSAAALRPTGNPPVVTGGQADPFGGTDAYLITNLVVNGTNIVNSSNVYHTAVSGNLTGLHGSGVWLKTQSGEGTISLWSRGTTAGTNFPTATERITVTNEWQFFVVARDFSSATGTSNLAAGVLKEEATDLEEVLIYGAMGFTGTAEVAGGKLGYVPPSNVAITRQSDAISDITDLVTPGYLASADTGVFYFQVAQLSSGSTASAFELGESGDARQIAINNTPAGWKWVDYRNGNVDMTDANIDDGEFVKCAIRWTSAGLIELWVNGVLNYQHTAASGTYRFEEMVDNEVVNPFCIKEKGFGPYPSDVEIEEATSWDDPLIMAADLNFEAE